MNPSAATRFRPGQSGNPRGRPRGKSLGTLLRARLEDIDPATGQTIAERLVDALIGLALAGDFRAMKLILDRTEGKPPVRMQFAESEPAYVVASTEGEPPETEVPTPMIATVIPFVPELAKPPRAPAARSAAGAEHSPAGRQDWPAAAVV